MVSHSTTLAGTAHIVASLRGSGLGEVRAGTLIGCAKESAEGAILRWMERLVFFVRAATGSRRESAQVLPAETGDQSGHCANESRRKGAVPSPGQSIPLVPESALPSLPVLP